MELLLAAASSWLKPNSFTILFSHSDRTQDNTDIDTTHKNTTQNTHTHTHTHTHKHTHTHTHAHLHTASNILCTHFGGLSPQDQLHACMFS
jgi:ABC-type nickel/cobalt efflux system permease component RcnA